MRLTKKVVTILLVGAMTLPCAACQHKDENNSGDDQNQVVTQVVTDAEGNKVTDAEGNVVTEVVSKKADKNDNAAENQNPLGAKEENIIEDETGLVGFELSIGALPEDEQAVTTTVTTSPYITGNDGKIYVHQTDINGTTVTEAGGAPVTVEYTGTTVSSTTLATSYAEESYSPKMRTYQALWLDMSKRADFVFDGEFLIFDIKIKEDAPDGVYPLEFTHLDIANYDAHSLDVFANVGYIVVGDAQEPAVDNQKGSGLTLTPSVVSGKAGDTVQMVVDMDQNPGFVGFDLQFRYDCNAMDVVGGSAGKDFQSFADLTAHSFGD